MNYPIFDYFPTLPFAHNREVNINTSTNVVKKQNGGEYRELTGRKPVTQLKFNYNAELNQAHELKTFFENYRKELILFPDWHNTEKLELIAGEIKPRVNPLYNTVNYYNLNRKEQATTFNGWEVGEIVMPLRIGRITKINPIKQSHSVEYGITFQEINQSIDDNASYIYDLDLINGTPYFPMYGDSSQAFNDFDKLNSIAHGETNIEFKQEDKPRVIEQSAPLFKDEINNLINLFISNGGRAYPVYIQSGQEELINHEPINQGSNQITVKGLHSNLLDNRYNILSIKTRTEQQVLHNIGLSLDEDEDTTTITFSEVLNFSADKAHITFIIYARFATDSLRFNINNDTSTPKLRFIEILDQPNDIAIDLFNCYSITSTNHTLNLNDSGFSQLVDGVLYHPANISHDALKHSAEQIAQECVIDYHRNIDDPTNEPSIELGNSRVTVTRVINDEPTVIYNGYINEYSDKDNMINLKYSTFKNLDKTKLPTQFIQPLCPYNLGGFGCGRDNVVNTFSTPTIIAAERNIITLDAPAIASERGYIYSGINNATPNLILSASADGLTLTMSDTYNGEIGAVVELRPFCPKTIDACINLYDNLDNYGGTPYVPKTSPQLTAININPSDGQTAGKK